MNSEPARIFAFFPRFGKPSSGRELRTGFSLRWRRSELLPILGPPCWHFSSHSRSGRAGCRYVLPRQAQGHSQRLLRCHRFRRDRGVRISPLFALIVHGNGAEQCLLSRAKRTWPEDGVRSAYDPKRTWIPLKSRSAAVCGQVCYPFRRKHGSHDQ
jgi:hypothetical protein